MPKQKKAGKARTHKTVKTDEAEMKRIARELLLEASGQVDDPHEAAESETQRGIRLAREAMERGSGGTSQGASSPAPEADSADRQPAEGGPAPKGAAKGKEPAAEKPRPLPIPGVGTNVDAVVASICAQLKVQFHSACPQGAGPMVVPDGQFPVSLRNAAVSSVRQLDAPHPSTWRPEVASAFWARFRELVVDRERMARAAGWRLGNDRLATSVAVFKQFVRTCAAQALLEAMGR